MKRKMLFFVLLFSTALLNAQEGFEDLQTNISKTMKILADHKPLKLTFEKQLVQASKEGELKKYFDKVSVYGVTNTTQFDPQNHKTAVVCMELQEIKGTIMCIFNSQMLMNQIFLRPTYYTEGTDRTFFTRERFFSKEGPEGVDHKNTLNRASGHNLPGNELNAFFKLYDKDLTQPAASDKISRIFSSYEEQFYAALRRYIRSRGLRNNYAVIAVTPIGDYMSAVSHEFLHAQYFLQSAYAKNVDKYVESNLYGTREFKIFLKYAKKRVYPMIEDDTNLGRTVRHNEFMAYVFESKSYEHMLRVHPNYLAGMIKTMIPAEIRPAEIDAFFEDIYALWEENNFGEDVSVYKLMDAAKLIRDKYTFPESIDITQSPFYKFLDERGTPPIILK